MDGAQAGCDPAPKLELRQVSVARADGTHGWNICWEVENPGSAPVKLLSVRLPHGQFKSEEQRFTPALQLAGGEGKQFQSLVRCAEPAGLVTENAFVLFHCQWRGDAWRIFVRIRVTVTADGEPETATELVTSQKIGYSGISN